MQIKNHDDFPKFDHRSAPSFWAERDGVSDSPPLPRARPGEGRHDQLGNFQSALLGRITPVSTTNRQRIAWPSCRRPLTIRFQPDPPKPKGIATSRDPSKLVVLPRLTVNGHRCRQTSHHEGDGE